MSQQNQVIFNGRYELHRRLGRGGMAEVYLARRPTPRPPGGGQVLFPPWRPAGFVERFRREAQAAANLSTTSSACSTGARPTAPTSSSWSTSRPHAGRDAAGRGPPPPRPRRRDHGRHRRRARLRPPQRRGPPGREARQRAHHPRRRRRAAGIARAISDSSDQNLTKTGSVMGTATAFSPEQARARRSTPAATCTAWASCSTR